MDRLNRLVGVYGTTGRPFYRCAQCDAPIIANAGSELANERQVGNVWSCDACRSRSESAANPPKVNKAA
jgi:DNA-directed RNA polymerase subunit RPC12/RpoP